MDKLAETQFPIHDLLRRRWSPRAFADRLVEPEKLRSILEAARWAASSFNEQPWGFIVATKQDEPEWSRLLSCLVEGNQVWAKEAPVLMVSVAKLTFGRNGESNRHAWHDVGLAVGNLVVQATSLGLSVHQMAGILPDKVRELYGLPYGFDPVAGLALGYVGDPDSLPEPLGQREQAKRMRKPLAEFIFSTRWGQVSPLVT